MKSIRNRDRRYDSYEDDGAFLDPDWSEHQRPQRMKARERDPWMEREDLRERRRRRTGRPGKSLDHLL